MDAIVRPVDIHAKTRLQKILGRHCRDEDMALTDYDFMRKVIERWESQLEAPLIDPNE